MDVILDDTQCVCHRDGSCNGCHISSLSLLPVSSFVSRSELLFLSLPFSDSDEMRVFPRLSFLSLSLFLTYSVVISSL